MHMRREIAEIPEVAARLAAPEAQAEIAGAAARLRARDPAALITVARGSSDHAATYLKYAVEVTLGRPVASVGPSTVTVHDAPFRGAGLAVWAISQSGASRDLSALITRLGTGGADTLALTNTPGSPLAAAAGAVLDLRAGPERAVAATKSIVASIVAGLWLIAHWAGDAALTRALVRLPEALAAPPGPEAEAALLSLKDQRSAILLGRGAGLRLAAEGALKLIETAGLHASAYSGAEVLHGPAALLSGGFPVLAMTTGAGDGMAQALRQLRGQGAAVTALPPAKGTGHPLGDPLLDMPALYRGFVALAEARGRSTDAPPFLSKETRTL